MERLQLITPSKSASRQKSNFNVPKIREKMKSLDKIATDIILPIMKIQKKINMKFDVFSKDYAEIIKKAETANSEIKTHNEENRIDTMNITDIQLNQKYALDHENMIKFYEQVTNKLELFTNLINSGEYENLIKQFEKMVSEKELVSCFEETKEILEKMENEKIKLKKYVKQPKKINTNKDKQNKEKNKDNNSKENKENKEQIKKVSKKKELKEKSSKKNSITKHKKQESKDLLELIQKEFSNDAYAQKISKTFLKRRLFKKVIYENIFIYKSTGEISENKIRSSGESTVYKYGKFSFKFLNDELQTQNIEKLNKFYLRELKQCISKKNEEKKEYILAGKIGCLINEFLMKLVKKDLYNEFKIVQLTLEFYEFYEELLSEFNLKEKNVKIIQFDEKTLENYQKDFESLQKVRDYVKKLKNDENFE